MVGFVFFQREEYKKHESICTFYGCISKVYTMLEQYRRTYY